MTDIKRIEKLKKAPPIRVIDIVVIMALVIISVVLSLSGVLSGKEGKTLLVTYEGKTSEYSLDEEREITVNEVKIIIKDGKAFVSQSKCDDKICVAQGKISRVNESIVCLPQGVVLKITGKSAFDASTGQEG